MYSLISRLFFREKAPPQQTRMLLAFALLLWVPLAAGQINLGELLDAGAKKLTAEEFRQQVVQRVIVGPTLSGGDLEIMFTTTGSVQGVGSYAKGYPVMAAISGEWAIDDSGRVCVTMRMGAGPGGGMPDASLPSRCQTWFKYAEQYFLSDSDSDRRTRVLRRTIKQ